ncbi:hypothetical protein [Paenibacillus agaridevorans]|nr:hypothetical protein [Paenibacillus agaridevorans]
MAVQGQNEPEHRHFFVFAVSFMKELSHQANKTAFGTASSPLQIFLFVLT